MRKQSAKNKLRDMVTGSDNTGLLPINIIWCDEEIPEREPGDNRVYIVFTDFRKGNELREEANKSVITGEI